MTPRRVALPPRKRLPSAMVEIIHEAPAFSLEGVSPDEARLLYQRMLLARLIEEKMISRLKQGKLSKWFSGIGQEAIAVGVTSALHSDEYILPMHRNLGVFTTREVPLDRLFQQIMGKPGGFTKGRDRSFHFGTKEYHIVGMISHLGPQLSVGAGIALAYRLRKAGKVAAAFTGEGGTSEGEFHEALNTAAVWRLPIIFIIENNGYGLSTPTDEQFVNGRLFERAAAYGMEGFRVDGNNVLEVYRQVRRIAEALRTSPRPVLIEAVTFRMRGHEEASGTKYVPQEWMDAWAKRDPLITYEDFLKQEGLLTDDEIQRLRKEYARQIQQALHAAIQAPDVQPDPARELADVYPSFTPSVRPPDFEVPDGLETPVWAPSSPERHEVRYVDAIAEAHRQAMERWDDLILMGQDIADYGGVFKVTDGLATRFGKERVRNTPLCESAIVGIAHGLGIMGFRSMVEMQFADFVSNAMTQIVNNLAKSHYRWGHASNVVVRMPTGAGTAAGPFHSQSLEAWFMHVPGLVVLYPATPYDAKGLLLAAFEYPGPVMFFEHKFLYRSLKGKVWKNFYTLPIGKARTVRQGTDLSIITYGWGVHQALELQRRLGDAVSLDILDLRTLLPWDKEAVAESVRRTGKALILYEATLTMGPGAEIAAFIGDELFESLDGPVRRVASLDTPVPFAPPLEAQFLPWGRLEAAVQELLEY